MKPGTYEMVNSKCKPCFVAALEGRRLEVRRTDNGDGWVVIIKRTRKPIAGIRTVGNEAADNIMANFNTKRTVRGGFLLSDEGLNALANILWLAARSQLPPKEPREYNEAELADPKRPLPLTPGKRTDPATIEDKEDRE
jgi:hypothetical protein